MFTIDQLDEVAEVLQDVVALADVPGYADDMYLVTLADKARNALTDLAVGAVEASMVDQQ